MNDKFARIYLWLIRMGNHSGCHQRSDRSFCYKGFQFPVCARCTGVFIGYLLSIPCYFLFGAKPELIAAFAAIMLVDWAVQQFGIKESTNIRRLVTGICGGYAISSAEIMMIYYAIERIEYVLF